jgi:hypothetical protein
MLRSEYPRCHPDKAHDNRKVAPDFQAADASPATPRTLDGLWDLLNKIAQSEDVYSIEDAVFSTEEEELKLWATLGTESADCSECRSP